MNIDDERAQIDAWYLEQLRLLHEPQLTWMDRKFEALGNLIASIPPFSWLDALLRGPVGPK